MSYNKLGFTSGQTLKAEHLNHMEEGIANVSWNDLTDKPFWDESIPIFESDGNRSGHEVVVSIKDSVTMGFVHILDKFLSIEDVVDGIGTVYSNGIHVDVTFEESGVVDGSVLGFKDPKTWLYDMWGSIGCIAVNSDETITLPETTGWSESGKIFTFKKGLYVVWTDSVSGEFSQYLAKLVFPENIKTIDEKYLPESVDGVVIRSSTADSTKKFKITVDDTGAITATEVTE